GATGTGKSSLAESEALAMATGKPLLSVESQRPLRILLVNLEEDQGAMDRRIAATMKHFQLSREDIGDRLHTSVKRAKRSNFKIPNQLRSGVVEPNEAAVRTLIEYVVKNSIDVVSIDPLRRTHRVNENDNVAMGEVIELYEQVAEEANCAVHLWHHFR